MTNEPTKLEKYLEENRGYLSKIPDNKKAVMIISGGLDSIVTSARLIEEYGMELFPLHIHRGQTNTVAENRSVSFFTRYFQKRYGSDKFHTPGKISVNIPPKEFKKDLIDYTKSKGHPMRDPIMHLLAVEYAVAVSQKIDGAVKSIYCAIVPEDYFPHSTLEGLRANTINTCINMGDWQWQISSPNIDPYLTKELFGKYEEIQWGTERNIPIGKTISCNNASKKTSYLACGDCSSCKRRHEAFLRVGVQDPTEYHNGYKIK